MKGVYMLLIKLDNNSTARVGSLGLLNFRKGFYAYSGSAMGGLENRIRRHLAKSKKLHWHIDYLLRKARIEELLALETLERTLECKTAYFLRRIGGSPVDKFGSSDCKCRSHLFYFNSKPVLSKSGFKEVLLP